MDYENVLGESKFPPYEQLKSGLIRLIEEGKITREDAARLLPELRESEDEKIRKALLDYFGEYKTLLVDKDVSSEQVLSYLERQKSLNLGAALEWLRENVCHYMHSEYNEFHRCVEYDGSIDKERLISDFEEVIRKSNLYSLENGSMMCEQKESHYTKRNALFDKCVENCDPEVMKEVSNKVDEMSGKEQKPTSTEDMPYIILEEKSEKPIIPNDRDEAAKEYAKTAFKKPHSDNPDEEVTIVEPDKYAGFIAGAKWDREQMMSEAVEGWVAVDSDTYGKRRVTLFPKKPVRDVLTEYKYWAATCPRYESIKLDSNAFPNLKWEDEPKKVKLIIVKEDVK